MKMVIILNKRTLGVREWGIGMNSHDGCPRGCYYCYACKIAMRFKRVKNREEWFNMTLKEGALERKFRKRRERIMYPTAHDITPENVNECITFLKNMLEPGNSILLTSKPDPDVIKQLRDELSPYKEQVQFRFTITSLDDNILKYHEPHAPRFHERMRALRESFVNGWKTSVSIEPFLDVDPIPLILLVYPYCSESIWVGTMSGKSLAWHDDYYLKINDENIKKYYPFLLDKLRYKDSIKNKGFSL